MSSKNNSSVILIDDDSDESSTSYGSASTLTTTNETSRSNTPTLSSSGRGGRSKGGRGGGRKSGKSKKKASNSQGMCSSTMFRYTCMGKEDHNSPIFGVQFHQKLAKDQPLIFATAGPRVCIYEATNKGSIKALLCFADPDPEESFYTCAWTIDDGGKPLLAAAGARGIVRIFSPESATCVKHFIGHGHAINDLVFHPTDQNLLLSASKDHSLRIWNIKYNICVAIFGGVEGHRDEVLAADIDITGSRIVSCGMDHSLKTWNLDKPQIKEAIKASYTFHLTQNNRPFPTVKQNFPDYSTRDVHKNYVDCAKWFGNFILSKSCENEIVCWKAGKTFQAWNEINYSTSEATTIHKFDIKDCGIWFIRFSMDYWKRMLAVGNINGKTYLFNLISNEPSDIKATVLSHPKCISAIRQTSLSRDGDVLICVCDDGTIWRWDRIEDLQNND